MAFRITIRAMKSRNGLEHCQGHRINTDVHEDIHKSLVTLKRSVERQQKNTSYSEFQSYVFILVSLPQEKKLVCENLLPCSGVYKK